MRDSKKQLSKRQKPSVMPDNLPKVMPAEVFYNKMALDDSFDMPIAEPERSAEK